MNPLPADAVKSSDETAENEIRRRAASGSWSITKAGLIWILVFTILAMAIGLLSLVGVFSTDGWGVAFLMLGLILFVLPGYLLGMLIGVCMCCTAPYPNAKLRAGISAFFLLAALTIPIVGFAAKGAIGSGVYQGLVVGFQMLVAICMIFWCLFHVAIGALCQNPSLHKFAILTMVVALANLAISLLVMMTILNKPAIQDREFSQYSAIVIVSNVIFLGVNASLCIKTRRLINQETTAVS
jgi:MFS family permease